MKPVLVVGGAGYVGSHACKALHKAGYNPIVLDDLSRGHREFVKWGPMEIGDVCNTDWVRCMLVKYKPVAVMHFAALAYVEESFRHPDAYYQVNVGGTLSLLNAMEREGFKNLVFSSSCAVYGNPNIDYPIFESAPKIPISPYGETKLAAERAIMAYKNAYGLKPVILRYFNAAGADIDGEIGEWHNPETHLIPLIFKAAESGKPFTINGDGYATRDGTCIRDFVHVDDLARAHVAAMERTLNYYDPLELQVFNLGSGKGYSICEIIETAGYTANKKINVTVGHRRKGDPSRLVAGTQVAFEYLHWLPIHPIETILGTAWAWEQKRRSNVT